jgi:hypothetical protein
MLFKLQTYGNFKSVRLNNFNHQVSLTMIKIISTLVLIFGTIVLYVQETHFFSNTFEINHLFFRALALGAILGGIVGWTQTRKVTDSLEKIQLFLISMIGLALMLPAFASYTNHAFAGERSNVTVQFLNHKALKTNRFGVGRHERKANQESIMADFYYTTFLKDNVSQRIRSHKMMFPPETASGTKVELPIRKGFWGYTFADVP